MREPPRPGVEFEHVRVLEKVRSRWRVEWIEPNPGLVDFVKSANLITPWRERKAFVRDERSAASLARSSEPGWDGYDGPLTGAVDLVFEATGEGLETGKGGVLDFQFATLERVCARAELEVP